MQLALSVNGQPAAQATAAAAGDTRFNFNPVPVRASDTVLVTVSFTATTGKIVTLYTPAIRMACSPRATPVLTAPPA